MRNIVFLDIETVADLDVLDRYPAPEPDGRLKDAEKIALDVRSKILERIEKGALNPNSAKVIAFGYFHPGDEQVTVRIDRDDEKKLLEELWEVIEGSFYVVGWNILGFDIPVIQRRSMLHGVSPVVSPPPLKRYTDTPICDLMQLMSGWGNLKYESLKLMASLYTTVEYDELENGANVSGMDDIQIANYLSKDVQSVVELYGRMAGIYFDHSY